MITLFLFFCATGLVYFLFFRKKEERRDKKMLTRILILVTYLNVATYLILPENVNSTIGVLSFLLLVFGHLACCYELYWNLLGKICPPQFRSLSVFAHFHLSLLLCFIFLRLLLVFSNKIYFLFNFYTFLPTFRIGEI